MAREKDKDDFYRPIPKWSGYLASRDGHIYSVKGHQGVKFRRLVENKNQDGYFVVQLSLGKGGGTKTKSVCVHKLVASAFLTKHTSQNLQIRHLDGNKENNSCDNLAFGTAKENADDRAKHGKTIKGSRMCTAKLTEAQVVEIKNRLRSVTPNKLGFGVRCLCGHYKSHRYWS